MAENRENKASLVGGALACVCCEEDSGTGTWRRAETQAWTENRPWAPSGSGRHVAHSDWRSRSVNRERIRLRNGSSQAPLASI